MAEYKLGKGPAVIDPRTIKMKAIFKELPPLPSAFSVDLSLGGIPDNYMYKNDVYGDCVIAGRAHQTLRFEAFEENKIITISDQEVVDEYFRESGGADSGLYLLNSLKYWRKGWFIGSKNYTIYAYASVEPKDRTDVKATTYLMRGVYTGLLLPSSAKTQTLWEVDDSPAGRPGSWGGHCFTGDTKVSLLTGEEITLKELSEKYIDKDFWVYSLDNEQNIVAGKGKHPRLTRKNAEIIKITLDNGEVIKCTKDHKFLMRDNTYKEAQYLSPNDSLMPLYRKSGRGGYEECFVPQDGTYHFTHEMISKQIIGNKPKIDIKKNSDRIIIHHKDFNKHNNSPENLEYMTFIDHTNLHKKHLSILNQTFDFRERSRHNMQKLWGNPEWKENRLLQNKINLDGKGFDSWDKEKLKNQPHLKLTTEKQREARKTNAKRIGLLNRGKKYSKKVLINHKIVSVEGVGFEDVYDFEVEKYHNFALSSGVFVHNCVYIYEYDDVGPTCMTWGYRQKMTWAFFEKYCDEAFGIIDNRNSWVDPATNPLDLDKLAQLLTEITGEPIPPPEDPKPVLAVVNKELPKGIIGTSYQVSLQAVGGKWPYTWRIASTVPSWLKLTENVITGVPTEKYSGRIAFQVTDAEGSYIVSIFDLLISESSPCQVGNGIAKTLNIYTKRMKRRGRFFYLNL